jgi:putative transcriptional regulator
MEFVKFNFPQNRTDPSAGKLLIAQPLLHDPNFTRSVVLLCEHNEEGTLGFVINHATSFTLEDILPELNASRFKVYSGGPVEENTLHMVHRIPAILGGIKVTEEIYWGGSYEILKTLIAEGECDAADVRLFLGYSGWGVGQLQQEMEEKTWLVATADINTVFETDEGLIWKKAVELLGNEYAFLNNIPVNPQFN